MARFIIRSIISTIITCCWSPFCSFVLVEVGSGDITVKILGVFSTPEQRASYRAQLGLDAPLLAAVCGLAGRQRLAGQAQGRLSTGHGSQSPDRREGMVGGRGRPVDPLEAGRGGCWP